MSIPFERKNTTEQQRRERPAGGGADGAASVEETAPPSAPVFGNGLNRAWLRARAVPLALLFGLFVAVYASTFQFMANRWSNDSAYQHGWLVIPVVLGVIWYRRERLARVPVGTHSAGLALIALALLLHLAEKALDLNGPSPLSIPIFVAGAVWFFLGTAFLRALAFPIAYLIFMIPIRADHAAGR
jgi:hypothetical protein